MTSNEKGGRRYLPFAFTEQVIAMLSAVLHSDVAVQISIRIMETFVEMRKYLANNSLILEKLNGLETHQIESDDNANLTGICRKQELSANLVIGWEPSFCARGRSDG